MSELRTSPRAFILLTAVARLFLIGSVQMGLIGTQRKSITSLTAEDLDRYPIWQFIGDEGENPEQDESFVRPVLSNFIPLDQASLFVAADLILADGFRVPGHISINDDRISQYPVAVLIFEGRYLNVPDADEPRERKRVARLLRREDHQVFPIHFQLKVPYEGESTYSSGELA